MSDFNVDFSDDFDVYVAPSGGGGTNVDIIILNNYPNYIQETENPLNYLYLKRIQHYGEVKNALNRF